MSTDNDLSTLLPDPPPPRPAAREAALAEALRRFDGRGARAQVEPDRRPVPARPIWARPQVAVFASAALVVLVSVPVWWTERDPILPSTPAPAPTEPPASLDLEPAPPKQSERTASDPPLTTPAEKAGSSPSGVPLPSPVAESDPASSDDAFAAMDSNLNRLPAFAPPPPPPASAASAPAKAAPALRAAPVAQRAGQATADAAEASEEEDRRIVVTGSRVERSELESRAPIAAVADIAPLDSEWNACTLRDPRRNPTVCRVSAQLGQGLALAWQGDVARAIRAFDRAITADPNSSLAYLNRGLAYQQQGDLDRALADLNRAVTRDRTGGQAYYHRSRLYRVRGDAARAEADARRAVELDPD